MAASLRSSERHYSARHSRLGLPCITPMAAAALCAAVTILTPLSAAAQIPFAAAANYAAGTGSFSLVSGDFNRDGRPDIAVANVISNNVSVLLGNGNGTYQTAVNYAVGSGPCSLAVADFNHDGDLDLVTANRDSANVSVLLGNGGGTFQAAVNCPTKASGSPFSVAVSDLNCDGKPDLTVANWGSGNISVLLGQGNGSFQTAVKISTNSLPGYPYSLTVDDFNGDATPDLAVASNDNSHNVGIFVGNGDGTFQAPVHYDVGGTLSSLAAGDFNGDGKLDLVVTHPVVSGTKYSVMLGNNDGSFQAAAHYSYAGSWDPESVVVADLDRDGKPDLVLANEATNNVLLLQGRGDGTFQTAGTLPTGSAPCSLSVGDLDGNGEPDIAVANANSNNVSILLNRSIHFSAIYPSEFTSSFAAGTGSFSLASGDFNRDGKPDLAVANVISNNVSVVLGNGDGTYQTAVNYAVGSGPCSLATTDFNCDGRLDLVTANRSSASVSVLLGNGEGTFQTAVDYPTGATCSPFSVAVGDFNCDGKPDLATANWGSGDISTLLGLGDGTFQAAITYPTDSLPGYAYSVAVGDFNGDAKPDLAVTSNDNSRNVGIFLGNGDGTFQTPVHYDVGGVLSSLAVGDLNCDGRLDLVMTHPSISGTKYSVLLGNSNGTFQSAAHYAYDGGWDPESVVVTDLDCDGKPDLVMANQVTNNVSVFFGKGDGTFESPVHYAAGYAPVSAAATDLNGDGRPDLAIADANGNAAAVLINRGGQFALATTALPVSLDHQTTTAVLRIMAKNNGKAGDTNVSLSTLHLGLTDAAGTPLSAIQANALLANVSVWLDANASGALEEMGDTLLITTSPLPLDSSGMLQLALPQSLAAQIAVGSPKPLLVSLTARPGARSLTPNSVKVTHLTASTSTAKDALFGCPLVLEYSLDTTTPPIEAVPVILSGFSVQ